MLATCRTVIVDEIHAIAATSAAPIWPVAGTAAGADRARAGAHRIVGDAEAIEECEVPDGSRAAAAKTASSSTAPVRSRISNWSCRRPLEAVMSARCGRGSMIGWPSSSASTAPHCFREHAQAADAWRHLSERLGEENVTAHPGSLSRTTPRRGTALEARRVKVLVATASLELASTSEM